MFGFPTKKDLNNLTKAFNRHTDHLTLVTGSLGGLDMRPIPVQTFPITDDFRWEEEKKAAAQLAVKHFSEIQDKAAKRLSSAHDTVDEAFDKFFTLLDKYGDKVNRDKADVMKQALEHLLACSPKKVIGNFQEFSLEIGWAYVWHYNKLIDTLAEKFPRCRAGIFASRLNYSDVLHISEEVLATLRVTSTVLEDVQRRYDLLEGLQNAMKADADWEELCKIWEALKGCYSDTEKYLNPDGSWWKSLGSKPVAGTLFTMGLAALPNAQFQGQLSREQRIKVFVTTAAMVKQGWDEWLRLNNEVVVPNLKIMFALKNDFARNKILCLCDIVTVNGYDLTNLPAELQACLEEKSLPEG